MAKQVPIYTIQVNPFEACILMGLIDSAGERVKQPLSGVINQLIAMKRDIENAAGVTKKILPDGMLEIRDIDGNRIIRPPCSWEIEGN